jgi:hypothetical protein
VVATPAVAPTLQGSVPLVPNAPVSHNRSPEWSPPPPRLGALPFPERRSRPAAQIVSRETAGGTNQQLLNYTAAESGDSAHRSLGVRRPANTVKLWARSMPPSSQAVRRSLATQGLGGPMYVRMRPSRPTLFGDGYIYWNIGPRIGNHRAPCTFPPRRKKSNRLASPLGGGSPCRPRLARKAQTRLRRQLARRS